MLRLMLSVKRRTANAASIGLPGAVWSTIIKTRLKVSRPPASWVSGFFCSPPAGPFSHWLAAGADMGACRIFSAPWREFGFPLHIVPLSTSQALQELADARKEGLPVSVETCPHYLHLSAEQIHDGATSSKCAPPIPGRDMW